MTLVAERPAARVPDAAPTGRAALPARFELPLAVLLGAGCLAARLVNIDRYTGSYPEGIRAEQLLLMAAGFRPFSDIFSDQGPWLLQALFPGYALLGGSLAGVRAVVVLASLVGLGGMYWIGRLLGGPAGALAGLVLLGLSPIYIQFSRLAVAEVLALAPAILAVGGALRFQRRPSDRWLIVAAVGLAVSLLIKPITLGAIPAVAAAVWLGGGRRRRNLLLLGAVSGAVVLIGVLLAGLPEIVQQIIQFRAASRQAEGWSASTNLKRFRAELAPEGIGLFAFAALGAVFMIRARAAWPLGLWLLASAATIMAHAPLHTKHFAVVVVPLVGLAAFGVGAAAQAVARPARGQLALAGALAVGLLVWGVALPGILATDRTILTSNDLFERDGARAWYDDAIATLRAASVPGEYVVTDHAYLAYAAARLTPPALVEASATRVRAGSLTDATAIEQTGRYEARAVLLWADKLSGLRRYRAWLTEGYTPVKVWAAEGDTRPVLWLRTDERLEAARAALRAGLQPVAADVVAGAWRIAGSSLDRTAAAPGELVSATLELEATAEAPAEARVQLSLADAAGQVLEDESEPLLAPGESARRIFWVGGLTLPAAPPGEYRVRATLADSRGKALGPPAELGGLRLRAP